MMPCPWMPLTKRNQHRCCCFILILFLVTPLPLNPTWAASPDKEKDLAPLMTNEECWRRLPTAEKGSGQTLPAWARQLAGPLPRTTAALLPLDFAHRTRNPLDARLRAEMRWVVAHANQCPYAETYALFDGRKAGLTDEAVKTLQQGDFSKRTAGEKAALEFARKMTEDSASVTDAEFAKLVKEFGEKKVAAMVLLTAYANFQDRLLNCLGTAVEESGPLAPVDVAFAPGTLASRTTMPVLPKKVPLPKPTGEGIVADPEAWTSLSYNVLQEKLENQKRRSTRISVPPWDEVEGRLPKGLFSRPSLVVWNQVCLGHVPELAVPWEMILRTSGAETITKWDRLFSISLFWVTTRAIQCPYCMGHCEMNWEVAGLSKEEVAERSRLLAGKDWSSFPTAQQHAFAFARKITEAPKSRVTEDIKTLQRDFGPEQAAIIVFFACRNNYMTRISNGFQLTLERDNVFYDYYNLKSPQGGTSK